MNSNLNDNLYKRFNLELEKSEVETGFIKYSKTTFEETLGPLRNPDSFQGSEKFQKMQRQILSESCRQMFFDFEKYDDWNYGFGWFIDKVFDGNFPRFLVRLQILLNLIFNLQILKYEMEQYTQQLGGYLDDYPILGITIKVYITKPPQILPTTSKIFSEEIKNSLGLLELEKAYQDILKNFEGGLGEFLSASTQEQLKDVVEDMYTACDATVSAVSNSQNGFRNIFVGKSPLKLGLNKWQINIFDELRDWMDKIKHGVEKNYTKEDVEQIVLLVSSFIRIVINKQK